MRIRFPLRPGQLGTRRTRRYDTRSARVEILRIEDGGLTRCCNTPNAEGHWARRRRARQPGGRRSEIVACVHAFRARDSGISHRQPLDRTNRSARIRRLQSCPSLRRHSGGLYAELATRSQTPIPRQPESRLPRRCTCAHTPGRCAPDCWRAASWPPPRGRDVSP
jgi:hypothetical protein